MQRKEKRVAVDLTGAQSPDAGGLRERIGAMPDVESKRTKNLRGRIAAASRSSASARTARWDAARWRTWTATESCSTSRATPRAPSTPGISVPRARPASALPSTRRAGRRPNIALRIRIVRKTGRWSGPGTHRAARQAYARRDVRARARRQARQPHARHRIARRRHVRHRRELLAGQIDALARRGLDRKPSPNMTLLDGARSGHLDGTRRRDDVGARP